VASSKLPEFFELKKSEFLKLYDEMDGSNDYCGDFIESIQCAMVRAGGCFMARSMIEQLIAPDLLKILSKNFIAAKYLREQRYPK
jgi:dsRNA-specific ribonuclease